MEPYLQLEHNLAEWAGYKPEQMVACSSGIAALHLAFECLRTKEFPADWQKARYEVIMSDFNMIACPRAVAMAGLESVFVDCDDRLLIDLAHTRTAIAPETAAILATHIYGRRVDMAILRKLCEYHGLSMIEDMAEIHGVKPDPCSDAACWSFYKNKIVAGEEGGAVAFKNKGDADKARQLRSLGFTEAHDFDHVPRGHNYRMSNIHAVLILDSLEEVDRNLEERRQIEKWYDEMLPVEWRMPPRDVPWVYDIRMPGLLPEGQARLVKDLNSRGIAARHAFKPMSQQAEFKTDRVPGSRAKVASQEVIYLPIRPGNTKNDIKAIADALTLG